MIIALLLSGFAFFGLTGNGDQFEDTMKMWHRAVKKSVDDDVRRDEALLIVDSAASALQKKETALVTAYETFLSVNRQYGASEAEYELAAERTEVVWRETDRILLEKRAALRRLLTDEEWKAVLGRIGEASLKWEKAIQKKLRKGDQSK